MKMNCIGGRLLLCLACIVFASCGGDEPLPVQADASGFTFRFSLPASLSVDTETRANVVKGLAVQDVWVFQFKSDGSDSKHQKYTDPGTGGNAWTVDGKLLTVRTGDTDFSNTPDWNGSRFYFITNAGDGLAAITTEAALKAYTQPVSGITADPASLVYGPYTYTYNPSATTSPVAILAPMERAYAKVTLDYTLASGITIDEVLVENVPDRIPMFYDEAAPPSVSYLADGQALTPADDGSGTGTYTASFYLPDNRRGNGSAVTEQEKNLSAKGPGGSLEGCTCIVMKGTYNYYPGVAGTEGIEVEYRFYPGSDMIRNYDMERGRHYTLTIHLKGANSSDARVSIKMGNVFTPSDPDGVEGDIIFN